MSQNILASAQMLTDEAEADLLEQAIPILDTAYADAGESACILPDDILSDLQSLSHYKTLTNPVSNTFYDEMRYTRLPKLRPESDILKQQAGVGVDLTKATIKHSPPMTSIDKANGDLPAKYRIIGKWMYDCIRAMGLVSSPHLFNIDLHVLNTDSIGYDITKAENLIKRLGELEDNGKPVFAMSYKRDGVSCRLYYENGELKHAGVRPGSKGPGGGIVAADIIDHVTGLTGVPLKLPQPLNIALGGELEILLSEFETVNTEQEKTGESPFANTRNACAGAMNALGDPGVPKKRRVQFIVHHIENHDKPSYKTAIERANWFNREFKCGATMVRVEPFKIANLAMMEAKAPDLDYEVDGIVIEVNDLEKGEQLGRRGGSDIGNPIWKMAWKFAEQSAIVTVKNIRWQIGRSGKATPIAEFDGVRLAGTTVTNCTLHNLGKVQYENIGIGAQGRIYKSGKIIPYWAETVKPVSQVDYPEKCPFCSTKTEIEEHDEDRVDSKTKKKHLVRVAELFCPNDNCPARNSLTFVHYLSGIGVKGVAEDVVGKMMAAGLLKSFADFYRATPQQLIGAGLSDREALLAVARIHMVSSADKEKDNQKLRDKALKASKEKKIIPLATLISALGIPGSGKGTGRELASTFGTIDKILTAKVADFEQVQNIGDKTASELENYFHTNQTAILDLLNYIEPEKIKSGKFSNMNFVLTGSPPYAGGKAFFEKLIEDNGGKVSGSVSRKTNVVIVGSDPGSKKDKAEELVLLWKNGDTKKGADIKMLSDPADIMQFFGLDKDDSRTF